MLSLFLVCLILILALCIIAKFRLLSLMTVSLILFILFAVHSGLIPTPLLKNLQSFPYKQNNLAFKQNNVIVLLGGGVADVSKTVLLPSLLTYSRIAMAAQSYLSCKKTQAHCTIITSGGDVREVGEPEAHVYKAELVRLGVDAHDIKSESKSRNTYENAKFSSQLIKQANYDQVFLVTSGIHMKRARLSFEHFGVTVIPLASDYMQINSSIFALGYNLTLSDAAIHEYLGIIKYQLFNFKNS